jgi:hypothetical protein
VCVVCSNNRTAHKSTSRHEIENERGERGERVIVDGKREGWKEKD